MAEKERDIIISEGGSQGGAALKRNAFFGKDVWMCIVVLAAIALVAGVLLGLVNWLTYVDPNEVIMQDVAAAYEVSVEQVTIDADRVVNDPSSKSVVSSVFTATDAAGEDIVYAYFVSGSGAYKGTVDYVIYVTPAGTIDKIEVYSSSETASIGGKVLKDANLAKFNGFDLTAVTDYNYVRDDKYDDVYISGATYTTRSVMNAVTAVAYAFNNYDAAEVNV